MILRHYHAVVWIDHREARIFDFSPSDVERLVLHPDRPAKHIHHKAHAVGSGNAAEDQNYFRAVVDALSGAGSILIVGPGVEKTDLMKFIHHHDPQLMMAIAGVETVDHPSDGQLVAYAKTYFRAADRMQPQKVETPGRPSGPTTAR